MAKIKKRAGKTDLHYENRQFHKERECKDHISHEVGEGGEIVSRSRSRASVNEQAAPSLPKRSSSRNRGASSSRKSSSPHRSQRSSKYRHSENNQHSHRESGRSSSSAQPQSDTGRNAAGHGSSKKSVSKTYTGREHCFEQKPGHKYPPCHKTDVWQHGKYVEDECGKGIVPKRFDFKGSQRIWCKTPLSMYQATIGELGRKILCREKIVARDIKPGPPCNVCECIMPPCRGYYRRYDCLRPCEEEYVSYKRGKKAYRGRTERYWEPCLTQEQKHSLDINSYAGQNVALAIKLRRSKQNIPCW